MTENADDVEGAETRSYNLQDVVDFHFRQNGLPPLKTITFFDKGIPVPQWLATVSDHDGEAVDDVLVFNSSCLMLQFEGDETPFVAVPLFQSDHLLTLDNTGVQISNIHFHNQIFYPVTMDMIHTKVLSPMQLINNIVWWPLEVFRVLWQKLTQKRVRF